MLVQRSTSTQPTCHPERPHEAHGLCKKCYLQRWRDANPARATAHERNRPKRVRQPSSTMATCHPNKPHKGHGMCGSCYRTWWKQTHPEQCREYSKRQYEKARLKRLSEPPKPRGKRVYERTQPTCHPEREHHARGLCKDCYKKKRREEGKGRREPRMYTAKWKLANKEWKYRRKYGIGFSERDAMLAAQGGLCAICRTRKATDTDHNHTTGKVRQMLCSSCNTGLGRFFEDPSVMRAAIRYLAQHDESSPLHTGILKVQLHRGHVNSAPPYLNRVPSVKSF